MKNLPSSETMNLLEEMPLSKSLFFFLYSYKMPFFVGSWLSTLSEETLFEICSVCTDDSSDFDPHEAQDVMLTAIHAYHEEIQANEDDYFNNDLIVELTKSLILSATLEYLRREGVVASDSTISINPFTDDEIAFIPEAYFEKLHQLAFIPSFEAVIRPVIEAKFGPFSQSRH